MTSNFKGKPHIDGSFRSVPGDYFEGEERNETSLLFNWKEDQRMASKGGLDIVETLSPDGIWGLIRKGKSFAQSLESEGKFEVIPRAPH